MDICSDKDLFLHCSFLDSACHNSQGTDILLQHWYNTGKIDLFLDFCGYSLSKQTTADQIPIIVEIQVLLEKFVKSMDKFLDFIDGKNLASKMPSDHGLEVENLIKELKVLTSPELKGKDIGSIFEQLEKTIPLIIKYIDKVTTGCSTTSLISTDLTSAMSFIKRKVHYTNAQYSYFIGIK